MFSLDSKFFGFLSKIGDLFVINILYLICSTPIITIGAATTAMYAVTKKMAANKEGYIIRTYFKEFKDNFIKSTILWLIMLLVVIVAIGDLMVGNIISNQTFQNLFRGAMILIIVLAIGAMMYALTLQCTFENSIKNTLKNAALMVILHFPWTILIVFITISPVLAVLFFTRFLAVELLVMFCVWFSGTAFINSFIFNHIYKRYM